MGDLQILSRYLPGTLGRIIQLPGTYYSAHWGFDSFFGAKVARKLSEFIDRFDHDSDGLWIAMLNDKVEGSIIIDGKDANANGAHLRWFIVSEELHGSGIGQQLMDAAMYFCRQRKWKRIYLWTFKGLLAARHLYEKAGFKLVMQSRGMQWGTMVIEQRL